MFIILGVILCDVQAVVRLQGLSKQGVKKGLYEGYHNVQYPRKLLLTIWLLVLVDEGCIILNPGLRLLLAPILLLKGWLELLLAGFEPIGGPLG